MIDGIVVALVTALLTALGALFIKWMNDIEAKVKRVDEVTTQLSSMVNRIEELEKCKLDTQAYGIQPEQLIEMVRSLVSSVREVRSRISKIASVTGRLQEIVHREHPHE